MKRRFASESGQALVMTVVFLVVLVGATALTIDFGAWYREQRQAQATADAAALAGAQALPTDPASALTLTKQYADSNGGGVSVGDISFRSDFAPNDTVVVHATRTSPSFFARIFSFGNVTVGATAAARSDVPSSVFGAAPIVVSESHPDVSGAGCGHSTTPPHPCFDTETTIFLGKKGVPGAFGLLDFNQGNGTTGNSTLASWVLHGYPGYLPLEPYDSDPGAKFDGTIQSALDARIGDVLLFPVYDGLTGQGANAPYNIIGWIGFHLDCYGLASSSTDCTQNNHGNNATLTGYFTTVIWDGLQSASGPQNEPDLGVYSVSLVN